MVRTGDIESRRTEQRRDGERRPSSLRFARSAKAVAETARSLGLVAPTFRSPPRLADRDRSLRRRPDGSVCVAVRLDGRPFVAVQSDLIEGVLAANGLVGPSAEAPRRVLWASLADSGEIAPDVAAA